MKKKKKKKKKQKQTKRISWVPLDNEPRDYSQPEQTKIRERERERVSDMKSDSHLAGSLAGCLGNGINPLAWKRRADLRMLYLGHLGLFSAGPSGSVVWVPSVWTQS